MFSEQGLETQAGMAGEWSITRSSLQGGGGRRVMRLVSQSGTLELSTAIDSWLGDLEAMSL